jgi:ribosomal-protein-alanine N-acetyltransferase
MERITVRRVRASDLPRILEIERASFGKDAYDRNLFAEYIHNCGDLFLVAVRGTSVCGYSIACLEVSTLPAELVSVAVAPRARKHGAASALIAGTIRRLRRRGAGRLNLVVKVTNRPAIAFYRKFGFRRLRRINGYYEDGADGIAMQKELY